MEPSIKETITSLELLKEINFFRKEEKRTESVHSDLLKVIRDEFEEEIGEGKISHTSTYKDSQGKERPMFILTIAQAKQVLARESKYVRKAVIGKLNELETKFKLPGTYKEALQALIVAEEVKEQQAITIKEQADYIDSNEESLIAYNTLVASDKLIPLKQIATILGLTKPGLLAKLRWLRIFNEDNRPYSEYHLQRKWFVTGFGKTLETSSWYATPKGLDGVIKKFKKIDEVKGWW